MGCFPSSPKHARDGLSSPIVAPSIKSNTSGGDAAEQGESTAPTGMSANTMSARDTSEATAAMHNEELCRACEQTVVNVHEGVRQSNGNIYHLSCVSWNLTDSSALSELLEQMTEHAKGGKTLVVAPASTQRIWVPGEGSVPVSFVELEEIKAVLSHRWDKTVTVNGKDFPTGFLKAQFSVNTWVDAVAHMNNASMCERVIATMGEMYATKPCRALYFETENLQTAWDGIIRGWMWQELVPGPQDHQYASDAVRSLHLLYQHKQAASALRAYHLGLRSPTESERRVPGLGSAPKHYDSWHQWRMRGVQTQAEGARQFVDEFYGGVRQENGKKGLRARGTPEERIRRKQASDSKLSEAFVNPFAPLGVGPSGASAMELTEEERRCHALRKLCDALLGYDVSFTVDEESAGLLERCLPLLAKHAPAWTSARTLPELVHEGMAHLRCANYSQRTDCVHASFAVLIQKSGLALDAQSVRQLVGEHFLGYMQAYNSWQVIEKLAGISDPFLIEPNPERCTVENITSVGFTPGEGFRSFDEASYEVQVVLSHDKIEVFTCCISEDARIAQRESPETGECVMVARTMAELLDKIQSKIREFLAG